MMLQDIYPSKLHNEYLADYQICSDDYVIFITENSIVAKVDEAISYPKVGDIEAIDRSKLIYLFSIDSEGFCLGNYAIEDSPFNSESSIITELEAKGFSLHNLRDIREAKLLSKKYIFGAYTAKHLTTWYGDNRFCGRCAGELVHSAKERAMCCPSCGNTIYPKIMPAVIVGVINGDRMLITRYQRGYNHNALIAGFAEIGETLEETVAREVMEEAGIRVKNIRYYKSQPWGTASDILVGYFCEVEGDDTIHRDNDELKFAEWLKRDEIELQPDEFSLTNEMMKRFKDGFEGSL